MASRILDIYVPRANGPIRSAPATPGIVISALLLAACCLLAASCGSGAPIRELGSQPPIGNKLQHVDEIRASIKDEIESHIKLVYPPNRSKIVSSSTFLVGACPPGSELTVNGKPVLLNSQGFFAHVVPIVPGTNKLLLNLDGPIKGAREIILLKDFPPTPIRSDVIKIAEGTIEPKQDRGVQSGDLIEFQVRATPFSQVTVELGGQRIQLRPAMAIVAKTHKGKRAKKHKHSPLPVDTEVNHGLDAAYGKVFQRLPANTPDLYVGFYKVTAFDKFQDLHPKFTLSHQSKSCTAVAKAKITTVLQPLLAHTKHDRTVVRFGPGLARTTPLVQDVRLMVDGWQGNEMRCMYRPSHHVWIAKEDLNFESELSSGQHQITSGPPPRAVARTINIQADSYGAAVRIPLNQRLPYQVEQQLSPNRIVLKLYGVTADTDWITNSQSQFDPQESSSTYSHVIDGVTWKQSADDLYEVIVNLQQHRQWGYWVAYEGNTLVLHIKAPPKLAGGTKPLSGLVVCLDPGHGGQENGSIGCSGVKESQVNLDMALKLKQLLEQEGVSTIMTRTSNEQGPSLQERVNTAVNHHADLLISIHNNALPDGGDPLTEHGTSSYWYHPQSIELAKVLKTALVKGTGLPDYGTRYQNLALARPTEMPAVLVEVGFMINPDEYAKLIDPAFQQKVAQALLEGMKSYVCENARY